MNILQQPPTVSLGINSSRKRRQRKITLRLKFPDSILEYPPPGKKDRDGGKSGGAPDISDDSDR